MTEERLPVYYQLIDGQPVTVQPYETFAGEDGELERVERSEWAGIEGLGPWLRERVARLGIQVVADQVGVDEARIRRYVAGGYNETHRKQVEWVSLTTVTLARVDQMLTNAGEPLWELYPYVDDDVEVDVETCFTCREDVMPVDGVCPWCETPVGKMRGAAGLVEIPVLTELPDARPQRQHRQRRRARLRTVRKPRLGKKGWEPISPPDRDAFKPETAIAVQRRGSGKWGQKLTDEHVRYAAEAYAAIPTFIYARDELHARHGLCGYVNPDALYQGLQRAWGMREWKSQQDVVAALARGDLEPAARIVRRRSRISEDLIYEAAFRYYICEYGLDRLSKILFARDPSGYATYKSLSCAVYDEFKYRGWPRRDRIEATRAASFKHGLAPRERPHASEYRRWLKHELGRAQPRCAAKNRNGQRKDERCLRPTVTGQRYCAQHMATDGGDELRAARARRHLEQMRVVAHDSEIPVAPFAAWLREQRTKAGSGKALADRYCEQHVKPSRSVQTAITRLCKERSAVVRRDTVERWLKVLEPELTVEQLYEPFMSLRRGA